MIGALMRRVWLVGLVLLSAGGARGAEATPAIAVSVESFGMARRGAAAWPILLVAAWADGRIVWSRDQRDGGAPYLRGRIEPERVTGVLQQFEKRGVFSRANLKQAWFGPDATYQAIWLQSGDRQTRLQTWHELAERNPKVVVVGGSIRPLEGRNRKEVLREDSAEFREFREVWSDLRRAIAGLIPKKGEEVVGALGMEWPRR